MQASYHGVYEGPGYYCLSENKGRRNRLERENNGDSCGKW